MEPSMQSQIARNTDPISSHEAAERIIANGMRGSHQRIVFNAVLENPDKTSRELSELCPLERHAVARRLPDLEDSGYIVKSGLRICSFGKKRAVTWAVRE